MGSSGYSLAQPDIVTDASKATPTPHAELFALAAAYPATAVP